MRKVGTINVDLVVRRTPTGQPTAVTIEPAVPVGWPQDWPRVLLYPLSDHLADKICAMYEWHAGGVSASTRCRDLADILLIAQHESVDGRAVQIALQSERRRRIGLGTDLRLPNQFEVPDQTFWNANYPKAAAEVTGLVGCRSLAEAVAAVSVFLNPLLSLSSPGRWDPLTARWEDDVDDWAKSAQPTVLDPWDDDD